MVFENLAVHHKAFGDGVITHTDGKYMKVRFAQTEKTFVYPDIFERFLTLADGTVPEEITRDLSFVKENKRKIEEEKLQENLRSMTHGIVIPGKEIVADGKEDGTQRETEEI